MSRLLLASLVPLLVSVSPTVPGPAAVPPATPTECLADPPPSEGPPLGAPRAEGEDLMDPRFGGGNGFFEVQAPAPGPRTTATTPIQLELSGPARLAPDRPLALRLTFANPSSGPVTVMRALDGSLEHWRHPHYDLYLRDEGTQRVYRWDYHGGRCGNVNPIRDEDYVTLAAGPRRDDVHGGWAAHVSQAAVGTPGVYTAWVVYRFCGHGGGGLPLGPNVERPVLEGVFASNAVRLEVR